MYYQELTQKFWVFGPKAQLSTTAVALYLYLLKLANDNNGYDVSVSDRTIGSTLGITRKTVKSAREALLNSGLVWYESKKGYSCSYRIVLNYPLPIPSQENSQKVIIKHNDLTSIAGKNENLASVGLPTLNIPKITDHKENASFYKYKAKPFKMVNKPSLEEFMDYAYTLSSYEASMDSDIKEKYAVWGNNDWCNNLGKPITNWKSSLKNLLPYIKNRTDNEQLSLESIPTIKPPK